VPESTSNRDKKKPIFGIRLQLCCSKVYDKRAMIDLLQSVSAKTSRSELYLSAPEIHCAGPLEATVGRRISNSSSNGNGCGHHLL
jgi:hypothetical protein